MIKAIVFDCFGVLTTDTWNAFLDNLPAGTDIEAAREVHRAYNAGLVNKADCAQQIQEITGSSFIELEDRVGQQIIKNEALLDVIRTLKPDYKIGMLSNIGSNWVREDFLSADEQALFDAMLFSFEIGFNKPDQRAFEKAAQTLGVELEEAVMIDDQAGYCEVARSLGMQTIVYKDLAQFKSEIDAILNHA